MENKMNEKLILYIQPKGFGDLLMSTPIFRELNKKYLEYKLDLLTEKGYDEILKGNPHINKIYNSEKMVNFNLYHKIFRPFVRTQSNEKWEKLGKHMVDLYASECSIKLNDYRTNIYPLKINLRKYGIKEEDKLICIQSKSGFIVKDWSYENFNKLIQILIKKGYKIITIGAKGDPHFKSTIDLIGKLNIRESAYIISKSKLFLGVDSIGLHMASSLNIIAIGLYGGTKAELVKPLSNNKFISIEPKYRNGCSEACHSACKKENLCIDNITIEQVYKTIKKFI